MTFLTGIDVYLAARKLIGTPYNHQGRVPGVGVDCIGLPILVCKDLGLGEFDQANYPRNPNGTLLLKIEEVCQTINLQPGALVIFKINVEAQHCGIVSNYFHGGLGLIHAWDLADKVVEHRLTKNWESKIVGCYGLPGVTYLEKD